MSENASDIYGFFLGNKDGVIYKESIFKEDRCPIDILTNVVKAICSFTEETKISDYGTIELSKSKISFRKIQDITYVLSHGIDKRKIANSVIGLLADEFEEKSRAKFHSSNPEQVFSGAAAVYNQTVELLFEPILKAPQVVKTNKAKKKQYPKLEIDLDLVDIPISFDDLMLDTKKTAKVEQEKLKDAKKPEKSEEPLTKDQMLSAVTFNILNSIAGIDHLVFVEHNQEEAKIFFQSGHLEDDFVEKTLLICEKYLENIIKIMKDEEMENSIQITEKHQIIFVPIDDSNFIYAVGTKEVDAVLMKPVFERIATRIKNVVLEYKESD
ncbi:MAG: hypothetical protein GOP50_02310 [Candidatus Heimdallarchaeota archaeon]|nr:hypothetical protein [Candidatus Heimdallarchaeota archaeon]